MEIENLNPINFLIYLAIYGVGFCGVVVLLKSPMSFFITLIIGGIISFFWFKMQPRQQF